MTNNTDTLTRWRGYLYINGSKTYDAIVSSQNKQAILQYVLTMIGEDDEYKVVVKKVKE